VFDPRNTQYYEKVSDPLDLSTIEKQITTGHYKTVEAFDTDMLKVFRNAEVGLPQSSSLWDIHGHGSFTHTSTEVSLIYCAGCKCHWNLLKGT
jgi:hypothetical protein